jgi:hypothetical protein
MVAATNDAMQSLGSPFVNSGSLVVPSERMKTRTMKTVATGSSQPLEPRSRGWPESSFGSETAPDTDFGSPPPSKP